jgi:hypothetical protein
MDTAHHSSGRAPARIGFAWRWGGVLQHLTAELLDHLLEAFIVLRHMARR